MKITIEIPEEEIKKAVLDVVVKQYYRDYSADRRVVKTVVSDCVRKVIYEDKESIVKQIVSQASLHLRNLAAKKMFNSMMEDEDEN